jgi:hypothetical protein
MLRLSYFLARLIDDAAKRLSFSRPHSRPETKAKTKSPLGNNLPTFLAAACSSILREIDQDAG